MFEQPASASSLQLRSFVELVRLTLQGPDPSDEVGRQRIATLQATIRRDAGSAPQSLLRDRLELAPHELNVVWLLAAIAIDPEVRRLVMALEPTPSSDPTLGCIQRIAYGSEPSYQALRELGETGRLRRLDIIERSDGGGLGLHAHRQTWALSRRVLALLHGDLSFDATMRFISIPAAARLDELAVCGNAADAVCDAMKRSAIVMACGMPGLGRRTLLVAAARAAGLEPLQIDAARLAKDLPTLAVQLRQVARECILLSHVPLIVGLDALSPDAINLVGTELIEQVSGVVLVTCGLHRPVLRWNRPVIAVEMSLPSSSQLGALWLAALGGGSAADAQHLANQYPLAPAMIRRAAEAALARAGDDRIQVEHIHAGVRAVVDDKLGHLAKRLRVTQSWADLVMSLDQTHAVIELMARVRERSRVYEQWGFGAKVGKGLGVSALFSGAPGTGKSMCAALIAQDLQLELYQVDLSKITSKWIGETEKNLAALFDAAEACHAILLFDEADALFGKRTEQKSSNDRHANNETNYLLQRLESYTGICILTSNHESNIDPAFQRRLSLHLRFELPDTDERSLLWRAMFPEAAPIEDSVDFDALAKRYEMSGGYIRNAALRAAFIAADGDGLITQAHLERASRLEYEAMGKLAPGNR